MRIKTATCAILVLLASICGANGVDYSFLADSGKEVMAKTHRTWEGTYEFWGLDTVAIEGQENLYVVMYTIPGDKERNSLIDFFVVGQGKKARYLWESPEDVKGVTPILEGIDVFPGKKEAEVIVRWRHPGQGLARTVQKFSYSAKGMRLADESFYTGKDEFRWIKSVREKE